MTNRTDIYKAAHKTSRKTTRTRKQTNNTPQMINLSNAFENFTLQVANLPDATRFEIEDLFEDYGGYGGNPVKAIGSAINEWLAGGRVD
jgi:hypothetical protein